MTHELTGTTQWWVYDWIASDTINSACSIDESFYMVTGDEERKARITVCVYILCYIVNIYISLYIYIYINVGVYVYIISIHVYMACPLDPPL